MKKIILTALSALVGCGLFTSCEVACADKYEKITDSGWRTYNFVEVGLEQIFQLFENTLRLDDDIQRGETGESPIYFGDETIFHDQQGWWRVMNWNGCRIKALPLNEKSLKTMGARWLAQSKYYSIDSIVVECIAPNRWSLKGHTRNDYNSETEVRMEISCVESLPFSNWDSVAFQIERMEGISHFSQPYPSTAIEITYSVTHPLLRKEKAAAAPYPFMEGTLELVATDVRTERKEQILIQIEDLFLDQRMLKVTMCGTTEVY